MSLRAESAGDFVVSDRFFDLYDRMIGDVEIPSVLSEVAEVVRGEFNAERATVYLIDAETQQLEAVAVIGNVSQMIRIPIEPTSLAGFCAATGRTFCVEDAYGDLTGVDEKLRFDRTWDQLNGFRTRDVMCAPAQYKGETLGVVQVLNGVGRAFGERDLRPLQSISRLIGYALYHARLYDDIITMKRLEKEKAQFMQVMVHELKSPVSASKMMLDALQTAHPQLKEIGGVDRIGQRLDQLGELIQDILVLAGVKSGTPLGEITMLDLVAHTHDICQQYRPQAEQKHLEFALDLPDEPVSIRIDSKGCHLVVSNLVGNAVKYTKEGAVTVSVARRDEQVELKVVDTGIGIPEKDVPKLFREFFRASNAKKSRIPGSGVGLAGVKHIVERFGGTLALETEQDKGSTFVVRLPLPTT